MLALKQRVARATRTSPGFHVNRRESSGSRICLAGMLRDRVAELPNLERDEGDRAA